GHDAERDRQAGGDREDEEHLEKIRERRRILVGVRGVRVEESAAIRAQFLDRFLRGDRSLRNLLQLPLERRQLLRRMKVLNHALRDEDNRGYRADREQGPRRAAGGAGP